MDIRYGVVEDEDVIEAGAKLDAAFLSIMVGASGDGAATEAATPALHPDLVAKLATLPGVK